MKAPPVIGVTLGDLNGIGPEVAWLAAQKLSRRFSARLVLIGSAPALAALTSARGQSAPPAWQPADGYPRAPVSAWDPAPATRLARTPGRITAAASRAAALWIRAAAQACLDGALQAMVTGPICKEGFHKAGISVPGHTEYLATLTGAKNFAMLLMGGRLRVLLATRHVPLARVSAELTRPLLRDALDLLAVGLPWLGAKQARIGVCGLNPHAGDGGLLGREEIRVIAPAIRAAQQRGIQAMGPVPADVIFYQALRGRYDAVLAMYHDQGLGPLKMLSFDTGVNVTLGLPIVRTSPDHGTAFDIAGAWRARPDSMLAAIRWAGALSRRPNPWRQPDSSIP